jgi:serine/threonine protein kinase
MLTGSVPYDGKSAMDIAMAHMTESLPSPLERNPDLHPACVRVLEKALQKEPAERYPSCAALANDLQRAIKQQIRQPSTVKHLSLLRVSEQVEAYQAAHPLPPLPAAVMAVQATPAQSPKTQQTAKPPETMVHPTNRRQTWMLVAVASAVIIVAGLAAVAALLTTRSNTASPIVPSATSPVSDPEITPSEAVSIAAPSTEITPTIEALILPTLTPTSTSTLTTVPPTMTPTATFTSSPPPLPTVTVQLYWDILLLANGEDTLYVMNASDASLPPFPLALLELRGEERGGLSGDDWPVDSLSAGECVRLERNERADAPNIPCTQVGEALRVGGPERFWKDERRSFAVQFGVGWEATCANSLVQTTGCSLQIPFSVSG